MNFETIATEWLEHNEVLLITLNEPKANILTTQMMGEIGVALESYRDEPTLRLVVLRGAGRNFSYGASVEEHRKEHLPAMLATFHSFIRELAAYPVPLAALVEGQCLGGAFEMVLCCHFVFAAEQALFACPEIKLGLLPPVLLAIGPQRLGAATAERLGLTGGDFSAKDAYHAGFVTKIISEDQEPQNFVLNWYRDHLQELSAFVLRQCVQASRQHSGFLTALGEPLAALEKHYLDHILPSHDGNEGIDAFSARRRPVWRNC